MAKGKQKITAQKDTFVKVLRYLKPYWFYLGAIPGFCRGERGADFVCAKAYRAGY